MSEAGAPRLRLVARDEPATSPTSELTLDDDGAAVDEWGASRAAIAAARAVSAMRWRVELSGWQHVPCDGGALLVTNPRPLAMVAPMVALALGEQLGRTIRFAGAPDHAPIGPLLRRAGGLLDRPDEVATALRGGDVVVVGAADPAGSMRRVGSWLGAARPGAQHAGAVPTHHLEVAARAGAPIHPVAVVGAPGRRGARVHVLPAVPMGPRRRAGVGGEVLADRLSAHLQARLDELAGGC